ncbi:hypothetical protein QBC39DRAFT_374422 [Podospora conica]|nr:hypothetical protein QBC39DRAFT_374422 [Schizothecium conicum]
MNPSEQQTMESDNDSLFGDSELDGSLFGDSESPDSPLDASESAQPALAQSEQPAVSRVAPRFLMPVVPQPPQVPTPPARTLRLPTLPSASSEPSFVAAPPEAYGLAPAATFTAPSFVAAPAEAYGPIANRIEDVPVVAGPPAPAPPAPAPPTLAFPTPAFRTPAPAATSTAPSFVAAPAGVYDPVTNWTEDEDVPVVATPPAPAPPAPAPPVPAANGPPVIGVGQIPGYQYREAVTQQNLTLLANIGDFGSDWSDTAIAETLAHFLTLQKKDTFPILSERLEISEDRRKKVLSPTCREWLTNSEEYRYLLDYTVVEPPNAATLAKKKINLLAASVGILRGGNRGIQWFGDDNRTLVWPRDSTVLCFHFAHLLYRVVTSHTQVEKNKSRRNSDTQSPTPVAAPVPAAAPVADIPDEYLTELVRPHPFSQHIPAAAPVPAAPARVAAPDHLHGVGEGLGNTFSNPIVVDAVSPAPSPREGTRESPVDLDPPGPEQAEPPRVSLSRSPSAEDVTPAPTGGTAAPAQAEPPRPSLSRSPSGDVAPAPPGSTAAPEQQQPPPKRKRKQYDWLPGGNDYHAISKFGPAKRVRRG